MKLKKPDKKSDRELWNLMAEKIFRGDYVFVKHAIQRLTDRNINDIDVLDILENKEGRRRKRNKRKDTYMTGMQDWKYCIEGNDVDGHKIRIIITFDVELLLVITVIRI